ncbi:MAG: 2-oxo acid dehydrogenase subunit E2 [Eubacteriales bacterium]|nr:2-oxo acid dehydrogenase subunit E2 [Eubacteriales bacterium]
MKNRIHLYVSRKNALTWLMALCMVGSVVARIALPGWKGTGEAVNLWSQILLPSAAALLYVLIALAYGEEQFYKTAIPVWMAALYSGLWFSQNMPSRLIAGLFWIALIFFASLYTDITAGRRKHAILLLLPVVATPMAFILYYYRGLLMVGSFLRVGPLLGDLLMLLGAFLGLLAIRVHPMGEYHPTWGDRTDGRRIRSMDPINQVVPYLMVHRNESFILYEDAIEITGIERYIRQKRREGLTSFGLTHVLLAGYCRTAAKYPGVNRFLSGQKIFSRGEDIQFCMTVKKEMSADAPETVIKLHLSPRDTAADVYRKFQAAVEEVKNTPLDSSLDNTAGLLNLIPGVVLKFTVWLLKLLDYFGMLPQFLLEVSPFHGSLYFTSMGSLGIKPVYHHLYNFGNMPAFGAFGTKRHANEVLEDGTVVVRKYLDVRFTLDERIVDGFYYAAFFKHFKRVLRHPELLDQPPEEVVRDID